MEEIGMENSDDGKNVLHFQDLTLSISEWCPFGQNAISSFNESIDSLKGIKSSLLTGTIDEAPTTSEFTIKPRFTRVTLEDFDRYDWIKFKAFVEYPERVVQIEEVGTHVDRSGFINYGLKLESIEDISTRFAVDDVTVVLADLIEDTSTMMESLLTQFQRRILRMIYGDTPFRPKFTVALTSDILPHHDSILDYKDGEKQQSEINQIIGIAYKFVDISENDKVIIGTNGMIVVSDRSDSFGKVLSFYGFVRSLQIFQTIFYNRLRRLWDRVKDIRSAIFTIEKEESIGIMEMELTELGADIVLIGEVISFMRLGITDMQRIWGAHQDSLDLSNRELVTILEIEREILVTRDKTTDMEIVSSGLVDEIQGLREMLNTLAEKRMREMSKLMADNVQQSSDAQQTMVANVKASRYSGAALKILSTISSGYLGMRISDVVMKGLDELNVQYWGEKEVLGTSNFYGGYLQVFVGFLFWIGFTLIFWRLIKDSSNKMKAEKLAKDFTLSLRIPIDIRSTPAKIKKYLDAKDIMFQNVELTSHRTSWYHREMVGEDELFYTMTMSYDLRAGHINFLQAITEDKSGKASFTTEFLLRDLREHDLISRKQEAYIRGRMGFPTEGGM
jgi:hypothetical protein